MNTTSSANQLNLRISCELLGQVPEPILDQLFFPLELRSELFPVLSIEDLMGCLNELCRDEDGRIFYNRSGRVGLSPFFPEEELTLIRTTAELAEEAHSDQSRKRSQEPYFSEHVLRVVQLVVHGAISYENACAEEHKGYEERRLRLDAALVVAALLHDVVEDSRVGSNQLETAIAKIRNYGDQGQRGVQLSAFLSKRDWRQYPGDPETDKAVMKFEAEQFYFNRLSSAPIEAIFIKCCDRIANISSDWVLPDYQSPDYALKSELPFRYFFQRLTDTLPEGGVMENLRDLLFGMVGRLVQTSTVEDARERLVVIQHSSAFNQPFLDESYKYDSVRYRPVRLLQNLIPQLEVLAAELTRDEFVTAEENWGEILAQSLHRVVDEQKNSPALQILGLDLLSGLDDLVDDLGRNRRAIQVLLPFCVAEIVSYGDSQAAFQVRKWSETWVQDLSDVLKNLRIISRLEKLVAHSLSEGETSRISIQASKTLVAAQANLFRDLIQQGRGLKSSSKVEILQEAYWDSKGPFEGAQWILQYSFNVFRESLGLADYPTGLVRPLLVSLDTYKRELQDAFSILDVSQSKMEARSPGLLFLRRDQTLYILRRDTPLYELAAVVRRYAEKWRRGEETKLVLQIEDSSGVARRIAEEEAKTDQVLFSTLSSFTERFWGIREPSEVEVVSEICNRAGQTIRSSRKHVFSSLFSRGDFANSSHEPLGDLVASFYRLDFSAQTNAKDGSGDVRSILGRIRTSPTLPNRFADLVLGADPIPLETEAELCNAAGARQLRLTLIAETPSAAAKLVKELVENGPLTVTVGKGAESETLHFQLKNFGSSLDDLATLGLGEQYIWMVDSRRLVELRILSKPLLEEDELRFREEIAPNIERDRPLAEPWEVPLRSLASSLFQGYRPKMNPNPYIDVRSSWFV